MDPDLFCKEQTSAAASCRIGWDNFPNKTKKTKINQNNENKSVSAPSRDSPALSTNTTRAPGGQWQGPAAAAAGKVACPFSQQHGITNHSLHCSAKPQHSKQTTINSRLELSSEMSSCQLPATAGSQG